MNNLMTTAYLAAAKICPKSPGPEADAAVNDIKGYILWGLGSLFIIGILVGIGAIVAGRVFSMPHASKVGIISIVVVFLSGICLLVLPGMFDTFVGKGCI